MWPARPRCSLRPARRRASTTSCIASLKWLPRRCSPGCARATWLQPRIWQRRTPSRSARPASFWQRETPPLLWQCSLPGGNRWWADEHLKVLVLQAVALQASGDQDQAVQLILDALALAEPEGLIRLFVDEGRPMAHLLSEAAVQGRMPDYIGKLLAACEAEQQKSEATASQLPPAQPSIEPLSRRELEVLRLIAQGLSNQEVSERLVLALETVKGHNKKIFGKLQVQRRTEAVARARELGLL